MKQFYFLAALLCGCAAPAQISLEHTYTNDIVQRVNLEYSGEKYYEVSYLTHEILLYNADHTFWKSIPITPTNGLGAGVFSLSEAKINPDANLEVIYSANYYIGSTPHIVTKVFSENGNTLLSVEDVNGMNVSELEGHSTKLLTITPEGVTQVYDLSGNLEHTYPYETKRIRLANGSAKYYFFDKGVGQLKMFNADHTLWKSIDLPKPIDASYRFLSTVSDTQINDDELIEVSYSYHQGNPGPYWETKLINENGVVLLTVPYASDLAINHLEGFPDKLIAKLSNNGFYNSVYSLPSLTLEHTYPTMTERVDMDGAGEKYYSSTPYYGQCVVYNSDHSVWKSINLPVPANSQLGQVSHVSQTKINADALVEVCYSHRLLVSEINYDETKIINELGNVLQTEPNCFDLKLSGAPEFATDKFIGFRFIQGVGFNGLVFGLDALSVQDYANTTLSIYPNPADNELQIKANHKITAVEIYNAMGALVKKAEGISITSIKTDDLTSGLYMLTLTDVTNRKSNHKILVSH